MLKKNSISFEPIGRPGEKPALVPADELASALEFVDESQQATVAALVRRPGIGLSCIKMRDDLRSAAGIMYSLDGFGDMGSAGRSNAIAEFGAMTSNSRGADAILAAAKATRGAMGLTRLPVPFVAVEFKHGGNELKSYVRADRMNERLENGRIVADRPQTASQMLPILEACLGKAGGDYVNSAYHVVEEVVERGGLLELVGLDCGYDGIDDAKLYFSPLADRSELDPAMTVTAIAAAALRACGLKRETSATIDYIGSMIAIGIPCNLIAVGFRGDGRMETKIYFDAWDTSAERKPLNLESVCIEKALSMTYAAAGAHLADGDKKRFLDEISMRSLAVDTVALDILNNARSVKVYARSHRDLGYGVGI